MSATTSTTSAAVDAAKATVLLLEAPHHGALVVAGKDRVTWLNGLLTCDLAKTKPGDGVYGLAVSQKGRIITDVTVLIGEATVTVVVPTAELAELQTGFDKYLIMEDAEISALEGARVFFAHGPLAASLVHAARESGGQGAPVDRTGFGGAVIVAEAQTSDAVVASVHTALVAAGGVLGTEADWTALRVERGVPELGHDFGPATLPQEVGLEKTAVSFNKGCYLGQEVICMLEMRGRVKRKLVRLLLETTPEALDATDLASANLPAKGAIVLDGEGQNVGEVTSASFVPALGSNVALAMVKRVLAVEGTELVVAGAKATVLPFIELAAHATAAAPVKPESGTGAAAAL